MDPISEIVETVVDAAPESTGTISQVSETTSTTTPATEASESAELPGGEKAPHREGVVTRKPGETRGRKSNAERMKAAQTSTQATLQEQLELQRQQLQAEYEEKLKQQRDYDITGRQISDGFIYSNVVFFGPEFDYFPPVKDANGNLVKDERQELYKVFRDMAEQYNWRQIPPWIQIALVMASYYGIRMAMPPVRQRFGGWLRGAFNWVGKKFKEWFQKGGNPKTVPMTPGAPQAKAA